MSNFPASVKPTGAPACECTRAPGIFFFDIIDGKILKANCKAYICPSCGPKKAYKFQVALTKYLNNFDFVRLFTFTQHTPPNLNLVHQTVHLSRAWSVFVKYVRRDPRLSKKQQKFDYVRVVEKTKRGYFHYHVCMSTFMPVLIMRELWNRALWLTFGRVGGRGGINIKTIANAKNVAKYLTKYLAKGVGEHFGNSRRWSKSNRVAIFELNYKVKQHLFFNVTAGNTLNLNKNSVTTQQFRKLLRFEPGNSELNEELIALFYDFIGYSPKNQN